MQLIYFFSWVLFNSIGKISCCRKKDLRFYSTYIKTNWFLNPIIKGSHQKQTLEVELLPQKKKKYIYIYIYIFIFSNLCVRLYTNLECCEIIMIFLLCSTKDPLVKWQVTQVSTQNDSNFNAINDSLRFLHKIIPISMQ